MTRDKEKKQKGFTYIEALLYIAIVTIMLSTLVPFAWQILEGEAQSSVEQEVSSNARNISERIKYEIRNSLGINSLTSNQIVLCETQGACATNPTTITYTNPNVTIQDHGATAVNLNSNFASISATTFFTNNTSGTGSTENVSFVFIAQNNYPGNRRDFIYMKTIQSSAEVRSN